MPNWQDQLSDDADFSCGWDNGSWSFFFLNAIVRLRHIRNCGSNFHIRSATCGFADPASKSASAVRTFADVRKSLRMSC